MEPITFTVKWENLDWWYVHGNWYVHIRGRLGNESCRDSLCKLPRQISNDEREQASVILQSNDDPFLCTGGDSLFF